MVTFLLVNSSGEALNCTSSKSEVKQSRPFRGTLDWWLWRSQPHHGALTFLQGALVGRPVSSDDVEDPQQLQDVLYAASVLATASFGLGRLSGQAQYLTALNDRKRAGTETARAPAHTVFADILEEGGRAEDSSLSDTSK